MARKTTNSSSSKAASSRRKTPRAAASRQTTKDAPITRRQKKPVFGFGTWISVVLLAVMVGLAISINKKKAATAEETPTQESSSLFALTEGTVSSIEIKPAEGEPVRIARSKEDVWMLILPNESVEADQGSSEAAATQVSALQVVRSVDGSLDIFGLDHPIYVITIEFASGKKHTIDIGSNTPTNSGYYARVDNDKLVIIDLNGIEALLRLQAAPPFKNTPTPTFTPQPPTETPTPVPPTETIPASEASVTPTP